jgi:hypothetical protein
MVTNISRYLNIHHKNLTRAIKKRVNFKSDLTNQLWISSDKLLRSGMRINGKVKKMINSFWHDNT